MNKEEKIKQIIKEENSNKEFDYISILIAKKGILSDILERIDETKEEK